LQENSWVTDFEFSDTNRGKRCQGGGRGNEKSKRERHLGGPVRLLNKKGGRSRMKRKGTSQAKRVAVSAGEGKKIEEREGWKFELARSLTRRGT